MKNDCFRVCADVDLSAIRANIINIRKNLDSGTKICSVIKADGYGHGALPAARAVYDLADFFAVATIGEALALRKNGIDKPLLILGYIDPSGYEDALRENIRLTVFDMESARLISETALKENRQALIHIKVDTGMSRIGFFPDEESLRTIKEISELPGIKIEGIFTHFFASDSADKTSAEGQFRVFKKFCEDLKREGVHIPIRHCCNSAAAISMPQAQMDMVRLGIAQYGLYPSDAVKEIELVPALSLKSHIVMAKTVPQGTSIGYGATFTAPCDMRVATIPVGYGDGYFRNLSNKGYVLINGKAAPIRGRVCMDQFMADISQIPEAGRGEEVILVGKSKDKTLTMEEVSALAGTFNYEFACDIGKRVPRRYFLDGKYVGSWDYFSGIY